MRRRKFEAVENLIDHAHETNDIFLLAAKVIASVLCEARALYKNTLLGDFSHAFTNDIVNCSALRMAAIIKSLSRHQRHKV